MIYVFFASGAKTEIFRDNMVNTLAADAPALGFDRSSANRLSKMPDMRVPVFHKMGPNHMCDLSIAKF